MKVCEKCGDEISTKDGENLCFRCDAILAGENAMKQARRNRKARERRRDSEAALSSLGLVKVKGALGGTYWE